MLRARALPVCLGVVVISACAGHRNERPAPLAASIDWRLVATDADKDRLRRWRLAFTQALQKAAAAHGPEIAAAGPLLDPDAALPSPRPPAGAYRCRTIRLGSTIAPYPDYLALNPQPCRIDAEGGALRFAVTGGAQRPQGVLYPDPGTRMLFLGTMMLGDESRPFRYGRDEQRDMIGTFERIGSNRWRLVLPFPHWASTLDVIEVTPRRERAG